MFLQLHKHLLLCILPHVCPDVFLQCILPGRIDFIYFLFILHEKLFDVLKVFFFFYIFVYSSTFWSYVWLSNFDIQLPFAVLRKMNQSLWSLFRKGDLLPSLISLS